MSIEEANEELNLNLPEGDFETVAGFVLDVLGRIPSEGEHLEHRDLRIEILKMDNLKIESIKVARSRPVEGGDSVEAGTG